jgi:hypothetical protein
VVDLECDSHWSAGGLHQQINKGKSRRVTRRQGVDIAKAAGQANECVQLDAFGATIQSNGVCSSGEPKRTGAKRFGRDLTMREELSQYFAVVRHFGEEE